MSSSVDHERKRRELDQRACELDEQERSLERINAQHAAAEADPRPAFARNPFREALTVELAVGRFAPHAVDAGADLTALAHDRALDGPVVPAARSLPTEAREELADARNYLVWHHAMRHDAGAGPDELEAIERSLAALAAAWWELETVTAFEAPP